MEKTIGRPVATNEFQKVLNRQAERDKFVKQVEAELKAIKPGECLAYESDPRVPLWAGIGLHLLIDKIKGLEIIQEENHAYIYRRE